MPLSRAGQPQGLLPWMLPSLCAALSAVMLLILSGLFFAFPCRWLVQNGEWVYPVILGPLFVLTFCCLIALNGSDPGTLHQGSNELDPMMMPVVWVNHRAFHLQWCPKCRFHRPPRTHHCPRCNICVEGSIGVAVPAAGFLVPLFVLLLIKAWSVSKAERSHEGKYQYLYVKNPFDLGCARNWCFTIFAPRGPKYMAEAVGLQRAVGPDWVPMQTLHCSTGPSGPSLPAVPGPGARPHAQTQGLYTPGRAPPGSRDPADLQEATLNLELSV
ncbi:palmitoyltransferase ZDHHC19-like isoform X3 [Equus przewalskii]|uniref:Palmitoyltransferase ZDHHC19-like isoform X3 n=1 Tax=Equus przewalskii TaxID=9798 RepID=A0ABM4M3U9_EQUPR